MSPLKSGRSRAYGHERYAALSGQIDYPLDILRGPRSQDALRPYPMGETQINGVLFQHVGLTADIASAEYS